MKTFKGIDISVWQEPRKINYDLLAKEIDFAILRVGFTGHGTGESYYKDSTFETHYAELSKRGVPIGVYWYSCANTVNKGVAEANEVLRHIKGKKLEYPIYWDTEDNHHQRPTSTKTLTATAKAFCETIEKAGYYVGIYASASWLKSELDMGALAAYDVWVAHYGVDKPSYNGPYGMWQYTSTGRLNGYNGPLDVNISYKDYKSIIGGETVAPKPTPAPKPSKKSVVEVAKDIWNGVHGNDPERKANLKKLGYTDAEITAIYKQVDATAPNKKPQLKEYIVKKGDTLSGIAAKLKVTLAHIKKSNPQIKNVNLIHPGDKIKY